MNGPIPVRNVTVVEGDRQIANILTREGAAIYPAYACRYDGFANDVFSEYANPSVVRPASVRAARLVSELSVVFSREADEKAHAHPLEGQERLFHTDVGARLYSEPGEYYLGWTMYDPAGPGPAGPGPAGAEQNLTVWLGARMLGYVRGARGANRLRLYVLQEPFFIDNGERLRLLTDPDDAPYRIENIVLLRALPEASSTALEIDNLVAETEPTADGDPLVRLNWHTSDPATCMVRFGSGRDGEAEVTEERALANHSLALSGLRAEPEAWFEIHAISGLDEEVATERQPLAPYLPAPKGVTRPGSVSFSVSNPLDMPVRRWPVTWGLPFPRATLWSLEHTRLMDPHGNTLPCQKRVQVYWEDGSVRWALLDLQIDLSARGSADLTLEYGPDVAARAGGEVPGGGLRVTSSPSGVVVDAGVLRASIERDKYVFPARIEVRRRDAWMPLTSDPGSLLPVALTDTGGQVYRGEVDEIALEESGPLRAVVRVAITHRAAEGRALFRSVLRLTAYHGQPFLRVQHTWENDHTDELYTTIRSLTLGAGLSPGWTDSARLGDLALPLGDGPAALRQPLPEQYTIRQGDALRHEGARAEPWILLEGETGALAVAMRDLWQNYPKGWTARREGLEIGICPDVSDVAFPQGGVEEVRSFFYLQGGVYKLKRGMARTHDMLFSVGATAEEALAPVAAFSAPPLVRMDPELLIQTGVLSPFALRGGPGAEGYDAWVGQALDIYTQDRHETQAYGMLNYGDWYGERRSNWGDMEYDTPYGFLLEYLRGGSPEAYALGWQAAWHLVDVDTCHYHEDRNRAGRQYLHSLGHVGGYYPDGYLPGAIAQESMSWTHTWVEGLFLYALLTGERRLWEVASRTMEILAGADLNHYDFTNCRDSGWPLRHLIGAYQATGRRLFLNGARIIVERVLERQRSTGGWERLMVPGHCFHVPPRHMGNAGFMVGILLAALRRYHEETGDAAVGEAIVAAARFLVRDMWEPEHDAFRYTSCPQSTIAPSLNAQVMEGLGYAWRISQDEGLRDVLLRSWEACLEEALSTTPPYGKDVSMRLRSMPFILRDVAEASER